MKIKWVSHPRLRKLWHRNNFLKIWRKKINLFRVSITLHMNLSNLWKYPLLWLSIFSLRRKWRRAVKWWPKWAQSLQEMKLIHSHLKKSLLLWEVLLNKKSRKKKRRLTIHSNNLWERRMWWTILHRLRQS